MSVTFSQKHCVLRGFEVFGLVTSFDCVLNSTVMVLRRTIYGGRVLLVIALVIAIC